MVHHLMVLRIRFVPSKRSGFAGARYQAILDEPVAEPPVREQIHAVESTTNGSNLRENLPARRGAVALQSITTCHTT